MTNVQHTILAVDDEPRALLLLRHLLEVEHRRVLTATNGPEALQIAVAEEPDVILLDVMMPEMDGFEVCRQLRTHARLQHVPILMLTALDDRPSRLRGLELGADDFLTKPYDTAELRTRVRSIVRLNRFRSLYQERARFETAVSFSPDGVVLTEEDGRVLLANESFQRLVTLSVDIGASFGTFVSPAAFERIRTSLNGVTHGAGAPVELTLLNAHRPETIVEITAGRMPWEERTVLQFNIRDITERKALEQQFLRAQRTEILGQLAGGIVHDANNIFTAILSSAALLEGSRVEEARLYLRNIETSAMRGSRLLQQLLLFARGTEGELQDINPQDVLHEIVDVIRETFGRTYRIEFESAPTLAVLRADATQLHQIVMNLCVNARDAMPRGGKIMLGMGTRSVAARETSADGGVAEPGEYLTISVRDTGPGIPAEVRARLFDPFFTTKPRGQGTGLGLATVLRLIRRHGGFVTLETAPGAGTCFTCHFPVKPAAELGKVA